MSEDPKLPRDEDTPTVVDPLSGSTRTPTLRGVPPVELEVPDNAALAELPQNGPAPLSLPPVTVSLAPDTEFDAPTETSQEQAPAALADALGIQDKMPVRELSEPVSTDLFGPPSGVGLPAGVVSGPAGTADTIPMHSVAGPPPIPAVQPMVVVKLGALAAQAAASEGSLPPVALPGLPPVAVPPPEKLIVEAVPEAAAAEEIFFSKFPPAPPAEEAAPEPPTVEPFDSGGEVTYEQPQPKFGDGHGSFWTVIGLCALLALSSLVLAVYRLGKVDNGRITDRCISALVNEDKVSPAQAAEACK